MALPEPQFANYPGPHPDPPHDLDSYPLPTLSVRPPWFRFHIKDRDPIHFGRAGRNRFDDVNGSFGVLSLGSDFNHPSQPDGIVYPARHDPFRRAIALFERPDLQLWATPLGFDVLGRVLATYRFAILPNANVED